MYATIRRYRGLNAGSSQEIMVRVQDGFVPLISALPGFLEYRVLEAGPGELVSLTVFTDRAGAEEAARRSQEWVSKNLSSFILDAPEITQGEIILELVGRLA